MYTLYIWSWPGCLKAFAAFGLIDFVLACMPIAPECKGTTWIKDVSLKNTVLSLGLIYISQNDLKSTAVTYFIGMFNNCIQAV